MKRNRELYTRIELTGEDQHSLFVSNTDGKGYYKQYLNLTYKQVIQHIKTELDSWKQEGRDEKAEDSRGDSSPDSPALADNTREAEE